MNAWRRALRGGRHEWRLHLLSACSVAVAFLCLAGALLLLTNIRQVAERFGHTGRASVYLKQESSRHEVQALLGALRAAPDVESVEHVPPEVARSQMLQTGDALLAELPLDAFPESLEVKLLEGSGPAAASRLAERLQLLPAVEAIDTYQAWNERILELLKSAQAAAAILALFVLAAAASVVAATIRLSLEKRAIEISVLRVVGATHSYVRRPFVIEGGVQGAGGAGLAVAVLVLLFFLVERRFDAQLKLLLGAPPSFLPGLVVGGLVVLGAALGAGSAYLSVRRLMAP